MSRRRWFLGRRPTAPPSPEAARPTGPDWVQADPVQIEAALQRSQQLPGGGWFVVGASRDLRSEPVAAVVDGHELVVWRGADGAPYAAPDACPHMGARLSTGRVDGDKVVCPWHGLALDKRGFRDWSCHAAHDDGVLVWVQLGSEPRTKTPPLPPRPRDGLAGVIQARGKCDPQDIIANRLDPWHGAWFHPYSFGDLEVLDTRDDVLRLRVSYRAFGPVYVEVDATFHCPGPRTIVMTIVDGEGVGSVVETHATPVRPGVTLMTEATLATSDRTGFRVARRFAPALRPFIERAAARLWVDDIAYAERRYDLRTAAASDASGRDGQMPVARPRAGTE